MPCAAFTTQRPAACSARRLHVCNAAPRTSGIAQAAPLASCSRRGAVAGVLLPALFLKLNVGEAQAEEVQVAATPAPEASSLADAPQQAVATAAPTAPWRSYIAREYSFSYPPGLRVIEEDIFLDAQPQKARSTLDVPVENPLKALVQSGDGRQRVSVVVKLASGIKPTFVQVTDITQWGDEREVAQLLLSAGSRVTSYDRITIPQPPREGPFGPIQRDPITLYRYDVVLADQTQLAMAVGARKGQIYVMGASATKDQWPQSGADLKRCAESFRLAA